MKVLFNKDPFLGVSSGRKRNAFHTGFRAIELRLELTRKLNLDLMQIAHRNEGGGVERAPYFPY